MNSIETPKISEISAKIKNMSSDNLLYINNLYCELTNDMDSIIYFQGQFNEALSHKKTTFEIANLLFYSKWKPSDNYFYFDGYGNIQGLEKITHHHLPDSIHVISEFIEENYKHFQILF